MSIQVMSDPHTKSVHVLLQDETGRLLLCTRSKTKETYPDLITSSAGGKVEDGENFLEAAERELYEELGVKDIPLIDYGTFTVNNVQEYALHHLFVGIVHSNTPLTIDTHEIAIAEWYFIDEIRKYIEDTPTAFADPFLLAFGVYEKPLQFVLDFDHTLFNWYRCKHELQQYLYEKYQITHDLFSHAKDLAEEEALYNIFSHLDQTARETKIDSASLHHALDVFMENAERFLYSDTLSLLQKLLSSPHTTILLSYGDTENQKFFIQATGLKKYIDDLHIVSSKKQKVIFIEDLIQKENGSVVSINDDPEESALVGAVVPFKYNNLVIERADAKFTDIPPHHSYHKILSLKEVIVPL